LGGSVPVYEGGTPLKAKTDQYTYTFKGWDKELSAISADTDYTAVFDSAVNQYSVSFLNYDATLLSTVKVAYGSVAVFDKETPVKPETSQYTYIFKSWSGSLENVTHDLTVVAQYEEKEKKFKVEYKNYDGTLLETDEVLYGENAHYDGTAPTKPDSDPYVYAFKGWDNSDVNVVKDMVLTAQYEEIQKVFTVTFLNYDDSVLSTDKVAYGGTADPGEAANPSKPSDDQYHYTFKAWSDSLENVTSDKSVKATYSADLNQFSVTYENWDGSVLDTQSVKYGQNASYTKGVPTKAKDAEYDYAFKGWDGSETNITKDTTLKAQFVSTRNSFLVTFVNWDDSVLDAQRVAYGEDATFAKDTPTKEQDERYLYTFKGWSDSLTHITEDKTLKATFDYALREYNVTYLNYDGTSLDAHKVAYGKNSSYLGTTPTKADDELHTYVFTGWDKSEDNVTSDTTFTAQFKDILRQYTATFYDGNNQLVYTAVVDAGTDAVYQGSTPAKASNEKYDYTFSGWDAPLTNIRADTKFTAQFSQTLRTFYVSFKNEDGTLLKTETVKYGETVAYTGDTPTKAKTAQYSYVFSSWDKPLENITNNCDRYAQYASSVNQYTVNFVNYDGTTLQTNTVDYGSSIEYSGAKPTKPADDDYGYVFTGWDNATSAITGDVTATAQFTKADYLDYVLSSDKSAYTVFSASGVTLPSKIGIPDTYLGLPVTRIGNSAFKETNIAEVLGGGKITEIGDCAFSSCRCLTSSFPCLSVSTIGQCAFSQCSSLKSLKLPDSVSSMGYGALSSTGLLEFVCPAALEAIPSEFLSGCPSLARVVIGNSVKTIGDSAFANLTLLSQINIPNSVTSIGKDVFFAWNVHSIVYLPKSVVTLADHAFEYYFGRVYSEALEQPSGWSWCWNIVPGRIDTVCCQAIFGCSDYGTTSDGIDYVISSVGGIHAEVTGLHNDASTINIPSKIENYDVTSIFKVAGSTSTGADQSLFLPDSITKFYSGSIFGGAFKTITYEGSVEQLKAACGSLAYTDVFSWVSAKYIICSDGTLEL